MTESIKEIPPEGLQEENDELSVALKEILDVMQDKFIAPYKEDLACELRKGLQVEQSSEDKKNLNLTQDLVYQLESDEKFRTEFLNAISEACDKLGSSLDKKWIERTDRALAREALSGVIFDPENNKDAAKKYGKLRRLIRFIPKFYQDVKGHLKSFLIGISAVGFDAYMLNYHFIGKLEEMTKGLNDIQTFTMGVAAGFVVFAPLVMAFKALDKYEGWQSTVLQYATSSIFGTLAGMLAAGQYKSELFLATPWTMLIGSTLVGWAYWSCGVQSRAIVMEMVDRRGFPSHSRQLISSLNNQRLHHLVREGLETILDFRMKEFLEDGVWGEFVRETLQASKKRTPQDQWTTTKVLLLARAEFENWMNEVDSPVTVINQDLLKDNKELTEEEETLVPLLHKLYRAKWNYEEVTKILEELVATKIGAEQLSRLLQKLPSNPRKWEVGKEAEFSFKE